MKITRKQLRRLISEAFKQKVPLFDPVSQSEIDTIRQKGRQDADLSGLDTSQIAKLKMLDQSDDSEIVMQARNLYQAFGSTEPEITPQSEQDFLGAQNDYLVDLQDYNIEQALEDVFINRNRDPKLLKQLGFFSIGDYSVQREYYEYFIGHVGAILNKSEFDMMLIDDTSRFFYSIKHFLDNHKHFRKSTHSRLLKVYSRKAKTTDVIAAQMFAVGIMIDGVDTIFI